jgi:hypothetical protein
MGMLWLVNIACFFFIADFLIKIQTNNAMKSGTVTAEDIKRQVVHRLYVVNTFKSSVLIEQGK